MRVADDYLGLPEILFYGAEQKLNWFIHLAKHRWTNLSDRYDVKNVGHHH